MNDDPRWKLVEEVFQKVCAANPTDRARALDELCAHDKALHDEVQSLLEAHDEGFLAAPVLRVDGPASRDAASPGDRAGAYRLVSRIGRGGMGEVWLADRADEAFEARVAVKIIRRGLDTEDVLARFRQERQVLASLRHPNIASVLDGGALEDGRPFLVMELIEGEPIDEHCERRGLGLEARLGLFLKVCDAVSEAHRSLVVHRDLKPSNVQVTPGGEPKLLDFGIAKMLEAEAGPEVTAAHHRRFTPNYASPELARGDPTTTSTDVYALGVLLYRLLTGRLPFDLGTTPSGEYSRVIKTQTPPKPSVAADPRGEGGTIGFARRLRGDLDQIVMVAMHKEADRRYASVEQLAEDLERFLDGRPVRAHADSAAYRAHKFMRRNRVMVGAASVVLLALVGAVVVSTGYALAATRQARIANAVVDFVRDDLLAQADPHEEPDPDIRLRTVLDRAAESIGDRFRDEPLVHSALRTTLGVAYQGLGDAVEAVEHLETAYALRLETLGATRPETLRAKSTLAGALIDAGEYERAGTLAAELRVTAPRRLGPNDPVSLASLKHEALVHDGLGEYDEALASMRVAAAAFIDALGAEHPEALTARNDLALMLVDSGEYEEAEPIVRAVLEARREALGPSHPDTLLSLASLGYLLSDLGRDAEAETVLGEAVRLAGETLGDEHPRKAAYQYLLATAIRGLGEPERAEPIAAEAYEIRRTGLGPEHPETLMSLSLVGSLLQDSGRLDEALEHFELRHELGVRAQGRAHASTLIAANNVGSCLLQMERPRDAEPILRETIKIGLAELPEGYWLVGVFQTNHGRALMELNRLDEAQAVLESARARLSEALGEDHDRVGKVIELLDQVAQRRSEG